MSLELKQGAVFIADAHENGANRKDFERFLRKMIAGELKTPQLFLMGDMFDFVTGGVKHSVKSHKREIDMIEQIAENREVFYFEGNHDFNLKNVFKNVKVIPLEAQPLFFESGGVRFAISHGDTYVGFWYDVYTLFIRNKVVDFIGNALDVGGWITRKIRNSQKDKNLCREIDDFENKISERLKNYENCDFIVEGHYHQNKTFTVGNKRYINLAAFACGSVFYVFNDCEFAEVGL